jgi:hypothetical protein
VRMSRMPVRLLLSLPLTPLTPILQNDGSKKRSSKDLGSVLSLFLIFIEVLMRRCSDGGDSEIGREGDGVGQGFV